MPAEKRRNLLIKLKTLSSSITDAHHVVGHVCKFSDLLLIFLLKARRPDVYRERQDVTAQVTGKLEVSWDTGMWLPRAPVGCWARGAVTSIVV